MLKIYLCILVIVVSGCSPKKEKVDKASLSQKLQQRNATYSKTDVLLAIKYQLDESLIKEISSRIKGEIRLVSDSTGKYEVQVDTNYAVTVRTGIETLSKRCNVSPQVIASILIDRGLLEMSETLPNAVGDEIVERMSPTEQ